MTTFPESFVLESSWLSDACTTRKDPESAYRLNDWPKTTRKLTPLTIKREAESCGGAVLLGPLTLLLSTWAPFSILSFSLSASVCPQTIHFQMNWGKRPRRLGVTNSRGHSQALEEITFPATKSHSLFWLFYGSLN